MQHGHALPPQQHAAFGSQHPAAGPAGAQQPHAPYPLHADLHAGGSSSGSQDFSEDVPWIIGTRLAPGQKIKRSALWGVIGLVIAGLHLAAAAIGLLQIVMLDPFAFRATLPFWGVLSLLLLASVIMCFIKRGTFNIVVGSIGAFTLVVSNPVIPLGFIAMLGG